MLSTKEVIKILKKFKVDSASKYGITSLGLFGSFARNQQNETSDVDVFVTLKESDFLYLNVSEKNWRIWFTKTLTS